MTEPTRSNQHLFGLLLFTHRFSVLVKSGVPLLQCLQILGKETPAPFPEIAMRLFQTISGWSAATREEVLARGETLSDELGKRSDLFSPFYTSIIRLGEIGGILDESLSFLSEMLEQAWDKTKSSGSPENAFVRLFFPESPASEGRPHDWKDLSDVAQKQTLVLFSQTLSFAHSTDVPMADSLSAAAETLPAVQKDQVKRIAQGNLENGISQPLAALGFLPDSVCCLLHIGEKYSLLEQELDNIESYWRHEA